MVNIDHRPPRGGAGYDLTRESIPLSAALGRAERVIEWALWLVPAAVAASGAWRPRWAVYLFAATLPLFGSVPGGPHLTIATVSALALVMVAAMRGQSPEFRYRWSALAAGVWLIVGLASMVPWQRLPVADWKGGLKILARLPLLHGHEPAFGWAVTANLVVGLLIAWATIRFIPRSQLPRLAAAVSVGVAVTLLIGLIARLGWIDLWLYRPSPRAMDDPRFQSLWVDSRRLAEYLVLAWPLGLAWGGLTGGGKRQRWLLGLFSGAALLGLTWSLQRGAWIAVAAQIAALAVVDRTLIRRHWQGLLAVAAVVALVVTFAPAIRRPLLERVFHGTDSSRVHYFLTAKDLFLERPVLGWGAGSWAHGYALVATDHGGAIRGADTAHGLPTQILAERGVVGLAAFGLVLAALAARKRTPTPQGADGVRGGVALSGLGLVVYGVFQYPPYLPALEWLLWLIAAMWVVATEESALEARMVKWVGGGLAVVALAAIPWQQPKPWQEPPRIGLFAWERAGLGRGAFALSRAPTHRWVSDYVAVEIPREGDWLSFRLIDGHALATKHPSYFRVVVDGELLLARAVPDSWHRCRLRVPRNSHVIFTDGFESGDLSAWTQEGDHTRPETALVEIEVDPGFRPFRSFAPRRSGRQRPRDIRRLGMVLGNTCNAALCWNDPVSRRLAQQAGFLGESGCFPDRPAQLSEGPTPAW